MMVAANILLIVLAVGVPLLIGWRMRGRWRIRALILWVLSPLIVLLAMAAIEMASRPTETELRNVLLGLGIIASVAAVPWLLACGAGFAIGAVLRQRRAVPQPVSAAWQPAAPVGVPVPAVALQPPSGWRPAHVGMARDGLVLDGLDVWALPWRPEGHPPVLLPHPAHPQQMHHFDIYSIDDGRAATHFAASELSGGVWGFYRWIVPADAPEGRSADGSLIYTHDHGPIIAGRPDAVGPTATLRDARTGAVLFDGRGWRESRVVPQEDGSLLLVLDRYGGRRLFGMDPVGRVFRDLDHPGGAWPLDRLAGAAAAALQEGSTPRGGAIERHLAPDGSVLVELEVVEWFNTHWVQTPRVIEPASGRVLIDLWGTDWDAVPSFPRARAVRLALRGYRSGARLAVTLDLAEDRYAIEGGGTGAIAALAGRLAEEAQMPPVELGPPGRPKVTARSLGVMLLILAGAAIAIAGATLATLRFAPEPPQHLDRVPPMPPGVKGGR